MGIMPPRRTLVSCMCFYVHLAPSLCGCLLSVHPWLPLTTDQHHGSPSSLPLYDPVGPSPRCSLPPCLDVVPVCVVASLPFLRLQCGGLSPLSRHRRGGPSPYRFLISALPRGPPLCLTPLRLLGALLSSIARVDLLPLRARISLLPRFLLASFCCRT